MGRIKDIVITIAEMVIQDKTDEEICEAIGLPFGEDALDWIYSEAVSETVKSIIEEA